MKRLDYMNACEKAGYKCEDDHGVLCIILKPEEYSDPNKRKEIKKLIKEIGYDCSWGIKPERKKNDGEKLQESK